MDYLSAFEISASGMAAEKTRLETIAMNLANANTPQRANETAYQPSRVLTAPKVSEFEAQLQDLSEAKLPAGVDVIGIEPMNVEPRLVYEPSHPFADKKGYVKYPGVNTVTEMLHLIEATRSYEANVKALNAAKAMALKALEIGRQK